MATSHLIADQRMSKRAKAYLLVAAARHISIGLICILMPTSFHSPSYRGVIDALSGVPLATSIELWGVLFVVTGLACLFAAIVGRETPARVGLLFSVVTTACWAGGFVASIFLGSGIGHTGAIIWLAVALKDATMLRQPLRNPFEPLVQKLAADRAKRNT